MVKDLTRSLKKEDLRVLRETRSSSPPLLSSSSSLLSSLSKRRTALSLLRSFPSSPTPPRHLPGGRGERRWSSSSNYFSLASKHFNATSTNELVLFSLPRNPLRHPTAEQNRVTSSPVCSHSLSALHPLLAVRTRSQLGHPLTRSPHYFNCANSNNSPR